MFGFIETKLAQVLDVPFEPFRLNCGADTAIVTRPYYVRVLNALVKIWEESGDTDFLMPIDKEADIAGMRVMVHKYYYDDAVLDGLTPGGVKETEQYEAIKGAGDGTQRFDVAGFERRIREIYAITPLETEEAPRPTFEPIREETTRRMDVEHEEHREVEEEAVAHRRRRRTAPRDVPVPPEAQEAPREETVATPASDSDFNHRLAKLETWGISFITKAGNEFRVAKLRNTDFISNDFLFDFAQKVKRHIIVGDDEARLREAKKLLSTKSAVDQSFLIIGTTPSSFNGSDFVQTAERNKSIAFSKEIMNLFIIKGTNVNSEINKIKDNEHLNKAEKEEKINDILTQQRNSPYAKYDKIFKDTVTNVVFALQDHNCITLTFSASENRDFSKIALNEIARRFDGTISYSELHKIDADYQAILEKDNCEQYVTFVCDSSTSVIRQLKKAYEDAKSAYEDYMGKAMESGKMCSKYMEQIESFNESEQQLKMKEKALEEYRAVKGIAKVNSVFIKDENIHIYTDNLYARDDRTKKMHDIGTFHITIGMHSNSYDNQSTVIIKNTKHQITAFNNSYMQAPHVFNEGYICHGTLATGMANAYKKRDLFQLVLQLVLFLQQANTDDAAGKYVHYWPEVSEEVIKMQETKTNSATKEQVEFLTKPEDEKFDVAFAQAIPV